MLYLDNDAELIVHIETITDGPRGCPEMIVGGYLFRANNENIKKYLESLDIFIKTGKYYRIFDGDVFDALKEYLSKNNYIYTFGDDSWALWQIYWDHCDYWESLFDININERRNKDIDRWVDAELLF